MVPLIIQGAKGKVYPGCLLASTSPSLIDVSARLRPGAYCKKKFSNKLILSAGTGSRELTNILTKGEQFNRLG
jgi:hypothetical protein